MELKKGSESIISHMKEMRRVVQSIGDNKYDCLSKTEWLQLYSSMDVIDDSQCAIDFYKRSDFPATPDSYLYIYGLMQALYLQQDAVNTIRKLVNLKYSCHEQFDTLEIIRNYRNDATGHPTNRNENGNIRYVRLIRSSIEKRGFSYAKTGGKMETEYIDLFKVIEEQESFLSCSILEIIGQFQRIESQGAKPKQKDSLIFQRPFENENNA